MVKTITMNTKYIYTILLMSMLSAIGCKKFLDEKPAKNLAVPSTLDELKLLLQNTGIFNEGNTSVAEAFADNYYVSVLDYPNMSQEASREKYKWGEGCFPNTAPSSEWSRIFQQLYVANVVLDALEKIQRTESNAKFWDEVKGTACFFRAKGWFEAIGIWTLPYKAATAAQELGIPIRTTPEFENKVPRSTLQQSVDAVLTDLLEAAAKCPLQTTYRSSPTRSAAYSLLSRVYLYTGQYEKCVEVSDSCLRVNNRLMNYNQINGSPNYPFPENNEEVIFVAKALSESPAIYSRAVIDSVLYGMYDDNDLRKTLYYRKNASNILAFRGSYAGSGAPFIGTTVDEIMLNYAEAAARTGKIAKAIELMNQLLVTRYKTGTYLPKSGLGQQETLDWVIKERRKELSYRCLRWNDLKRLNQEVRYAATIIHYIPGGEVRLIPGDKRYAAIIPEEATVKGGLEQNPR